MKTRSLADVMADDVVNTVLPIRASDLPTDVRRDAQRQATPEWTEVYQPPSSQEGCRYGCKVHMRRQGAVVRFALWHSTGYGHPRRPNRPAFTHDCDRCQFLGRWQGRDLYFCDKTVTVIARFGDDGPDYVSGCGGRNPGLVEAQRRAVRLAYLTDDGLAGPRWFT